ncbi:nicotinamide N-methyltransferase-like [Pseudophryne corroboree]|uniref:nicotinamide N-methyltransferase-like n=1 Tax=Pseudophryne corroboree TaxID=495146 RepID=UPI0030814DE8
MAIVSSSEDPVYDNNFDAKKYLDMFYRIDPKTRQVDKESDFLFTFLNDAFSSGRVKHKSLIEIGAGPSIHHILPACEYFEKIYITDYLQSNLQEIEKWLRDSSDAFDWSPYIRYVCILQNTRTTPEESAEKIRRKVSLMKCDVTKTNPLHPNSLPLTNCLLTVACLTSACKSFKEFKTALKNIVSLIKPGGHLILSDYFKAIYYVVGETKFPLLSLNEDFVKEAVSESGCETEQFKTFTEIRKPEDLFESKEVFCLLARKL